MRVLLTGGLGFIGSHTARLLLDYGFDVRIIDNFSSNVVNDVNGADVVEGDITKKDEVFNAVSGCDSIIHLAAIADVGSCASNPAICFSTNVNGSIHILNAARRHGVKRTVMASSAAVYGDCEGVLSEDMVPSPKSNYGETKLIMEMQAEKYSSSFGVSVVCLRYFNVYGKGCKGVFSALIKSFSEKKPFRMNGDGSQTRDFVHVSDVSRANLLALNSSASGVFNIGTGKSISIRELFDIFKSEMGFDPGVEFSELPKGDILHSVASTRRALEALGFSASVPVEKGARMFIRESLVS